MAHYYKIITEYSYFRTVYSGDVAHIPAGTRVKARCVSFDTIAGKRNKNLNIKLPVLHFCDSAFDTMLWHDGFFYMGDIVKAQIYEIKPLTPVFKERCSDELNIYQCGANAIEFTNKVSATDMYRRALKEFRENQQVKLDMYPNFQIDKIIADWMNNEVSKYVY